MDDTNRKILAIGVGLAGATGMTQLADHAAWYYPLLWALCWVLFAAMPVIWFWPKVHEHLSRVLARHAADEEESLDIIVAWWIAERSAWSRWQAAQGAPTEDQFRMTTAASVLLFAAQDGKIKITARPSAEIDRVELSRDLLRLAYLEIRPDPARIWKVTLRPCQGLAPAAASKITEPNYVGLSAKWSEVKALWPERDRRLDREIEALTKRKRDAA